MKIVEEGVTNPGPEPSEMIVPVGLAEGIGRMPGAGASVRSGSLHQAAPPSNRPATTPTAALRFMLISLSLNASSLIIGKFGRTGESQNPADLNWRGKGENL